MKHIDTSPWIPMSNPRQIKYLGKLGEELCEAGAATFRCLIQGIDKPHPVTGKINREWLEEELGDVFANAALCVDHFDLNATRIEDRKRQKWSS